MVCFFEARATHTIQFHSWVSGGTQGKAMEDYSLCYVRTCVCATGKDLGLLEFWYLGHILNLLVSQTLLAECFS
jgi:hypothetical protein